MVTYVKNRCLALALALAILGGTPPLRAAEDGSIEQQLLREIVNLRLDIEQQRREIRSLREEVGQMHAKIEGKPYRKGAVPPTAAGAPETYADAKGPTADAKTTSKSEKAAKTPKVIELDEVAKTTAGGKAYKVKSGETMSAIARSHKVTLDALQSANPGIDPKALKVGTELKIP